LLPFSSQSFVLPLLSRNVNVNIFENRVLRRIFGPKRIEAEGEWRKLQSGELHNLYLTPDIIRQIKSRRMRWEGHVARTGEGRNLDRVLVGKPEGKDHLKDQGVGRRMGSKWTLGRLAGGVEWIHLARDGDSWRAVVSAVMNFRVLVLGI
jgi:hypothetical protein